MIWYPPVGGIARIFLLNEVHAGEIRIAEDFCIPEMIIVAQLRTAKGTANHGLENQSSFDFLDDFVQGVKRVAQVIEDSHEQHIVKLAGYRVNIIDRTLGKLDLQVQYLGRKARLLQITIIHINPKHPAGATLL